MKVIRKCKYLIFVIIIIGITACIILNKNKLIENSDYIAVSEDLETEEIENFAKFYVDVKGAIKNPGVYEVDSDMIVNDVIKLAGGLKEEADTSIINLAKRVEDGDLIIIYTKEEVKNSNILEKETVVKVVDKECVCPNIQNDACINNEINDTITNKKDETDNKEENTKVNINTATKEQLMELSGIGESKADEIINYRKNNGNFKKIEDIMNVNGIGEAVYEKIKEYISI